LNFANASLEVPGFMRNIFLFIRRYFTFFTFLALQIVALLFLYNYNKTHRAKFLGLANEITGRMNIQYNKVEDYFHLREENRRLHKMNDSLLNLQSSNFLKQDTSLQLIQDSIPYDTLGHYRRYHSRPATVVYNSVNSQKNYIQINRGSRHGIKDDMSVISSDGCAVGVVVGVSPGFSQVMSLLHVQRKVNASLKKTGEFGTAEWDGKDPRFLTLRGIPKSVEIAKGDTVLTSSYSFSFPSGYIIGTVADILQDKSTNFYVLKLKTGADFFKLQHVFVFENLQLNEQTRLNEETRKKRPQKKLI
jgi:rod shape-determining protein MreC